LPTVEPALALEPVVGGDDGGPAHRQGFGQRPLRRQDRAQGDLASIDGEPQTGSQLAIQRPIAMQLRSKQVREMRTTFTDWIGQYKSNSGHRKGWTGGDAVIP